MIVLRDADKIHVGSIIAGSVILYQGTFEPVTAALPFVVLSYCYSHPFAATLLIDRYTTHLFNTTERKKEDRYHGRIISARACEAHLIGG
jgi:hypothetical protein